MVERRPLIGLLLGPLISIGGSKKLTFLYAMESQDDLVTLKELIEAGKVTPVIDRTYPLSKAAEALQHYATGKSQGKVVITL